MIDENKYKNKHITVKVDSTGEDKMSYYELARWLSLVEAVEFIDKKSKQLNKRDTDHSWVKPIAIQKYIDERTQGMLFELTKQGTL